MTSAYFASVASGAVVPDKIKIAYRAPLQLATPAFTLLSIFLVVCTDP